jgi:hypothetical protein
MITPKPAAVSAAPRLSAWRPVAAALALAALAACSAAPQSIAGKRAIAAPAVAEATDAWASNCYPQLERDVLKLAGDDAVDCGLLRLDATQEQHAAVEQCTREAEASHRPYRAGHVSISAGDTYMACDVAIRDPSGQRWRLWYDFDFGDRLSHGTSDGVLSVSRCRAIAFRPGSLLTGSFFDLADCQETASAAGSPVTTGAP